MILLKVVSDIHLNRPSNDISNLSISRIDNKSKDIKVLAILGDIGAQYDQFFKYVSTLDYDYVLFVPGNHEYYGSEYQTQLKYLRSLCEKYSITLLSRNMIEIGKVVFLGATLWTDIPASYSRLATKDLKELRTIKYGGIPLTLSKYLSLHRQDRDWISHTINNVKNNHTTVVVLTHHSPSFKLCRYCPDGNVDDNINVYFASNLDSLVQKVDLWCCGHIHQSKQIDNLLSNAYLAPNYNCDQVIKLN